MATRKILTVKCIFCPHLVGRKGGLACNWNSLKIPNKPTKKIILTHRYRDLCNLTVYFEELLPKEKITRIKYFYKKRLMTTMQAIKFYISIRFKQLWTSLTITYLKDYLRRNFSH